MEGVAHGAGRQGPYGVRAQMRKRSNISRIISGGFKVLENGMMPSASDERMLRYIMYDIWQQWPCVITYGYSKVMVMGHNL